MAIVKGSNERSYAYIFSCLNAISLLIAIWAVEVTRNNSEIILKFKTVLRLSNDIVSFNVIIVNPSVEMIASFKMIIQRCSQ